MLHLLLAAALSTASPKPLFVPPKGMKQIPADRLVRNSVERSKVSFVREYRGVMPFLTETITIVTRPTTINAAEFGAMALSDRAERGIDPSIRQWCARHAHCSLSSIKIDPVRKLASAPVALCNGQRGWVNQYTYDGHEIYRELFARAGAKMYVAVLRYQQPPGDRFGGTQALQTLCPPGLGEFRAPANAVPLTPPNGWIRSTDASSSFPEYTVLGVWYHVPKASITMQAMQLLSTSDTSEYTTPEQMAQTWASEMIESFPGARVVSDRATNVCGRADGWTTVAKVPDRVDRPTIVETVYAYGGDTLYVLQYSRLASSKEDPAARKALKSFCPPQSPTQ